MKHESIETNIGLMGVLIAIVISIGGIASAKPSDDELTAWLDPFFEMVLEEKGRPKVKIHGFGILRSNIISKYTKNIINAFFVIF